MAPKEKKATDHSPIWPGGGLDGFISAVSQLIQECGTDDAGTRRFIQRASEDYAFIRLQDIRQPIRFLKQMAGAPPWQFGPSGFHPDVVDDTNPARHYMAFVFLGFWLPHWLAVAGLWLWEMAGFVRYGYWATKDMRMGYIGIRHGRHVRKRGAAVLPGLIAIELTLGR